MYTSALHSSFWNHIVGFVFLTIIGIVLRGLLSGNPRGAPLVGVFRQPNWLHLYCNLKLGNHESWGPQHSHADYRRSNSFKQGSGYRAWHGWQPNSADCKYYFDPSRDAYRPI
jgi:hypothetical protein